MKLKLIMWWGKGLKAFMEVIWRKRVVTQSNSGWTLLVHIDSRLQAIHQKMQQV